MEPQKETNNDETVLEKDVQDTIVINEDEVVVTHSEHSELIPVKKFVLTLPMAILTGFALLALAIMLVVPGLKKDSGNTAPDAQAPETPTSVDKNVVKLRADDLVRGDASKAEVLLFTYSDSDCPFCAKFHPTVASVLADYQGKVAWVYRQLPLDSLHPNAYTEAMAMECVAKLGDNTKAFNYLDKLVNITLTPDPKSNETLITLAKEQGIDGEAFKNCFTDTSISKKIDASIAEAGKIGARGTPFSIAVNKKTGEQVVIPGAYPLDAVKEMIDSIL